MRNNLGTSNNSNGWTLYSKIGNPNEIEYVYAKDDLTNIQDRRKMKETVKALWNAFLRLDHVKDFDTVPVLCICCLLQYANIHVIDREISP